MKNIYLTSKKKIKQIQASIQNIKKRSAQLSTEHNIPTEHLFQHLYEQQLITKEELDQIQAILTSQQSPSAGNQERQGQYKPHFGSTTAFLLEEEQELLKRLV